LTLAYRVAGARGCARSAGSATPNRRGSAGAGFPQATVGAQPVEPSAPEERPTLCDMRTVTHREMRNQSGDILRQVADGETIQVTNNGRVAALIVPPGTDPLADLVSRGQMRVARTSPSSLRLIVRRKGTTDSQAIAADIRGRW